MGLANLQPHGAVVPAAIAGLVQLGEMPRPKAHVEYAQRSPQLMQYVTACRMKIRADREKNEAQSQIHNVQEVVKAQGVSEWSGQAVARIGYAIANNKRVAYSCELRNSHNCILETLAARIMLDQRLGMTMQREACIAFKSLIHAHALGRGRVIKGGARTADETQQRVALDPSMADAVFKDTPRDEDLKNVSAPSLVKFGELRWPVPVCINTNKTNDVPSPQ